jgi:lactoylglutathione lyase
MGAGCSAHAPSSDPDVAAFGRTPRGCRSPSYRDDCSFFEGNRAVKRIRGNKERRGGKAMPVQLFTHVGICVADLDRSLRFYVEALGFSRREPDGVVGTSIDPLVELDGVELEFRFLTRDGMSVELLHFVSPDPVGPAGRRPMNQLGLTHFGLAITDLDAVVRSIVEYGGQVYPHTRVSYRVDEDSPRIDSVYCTDPDGVRLELMEFFT